jgi:quinone-modifying oxidoreductase subunit QmoC
MASIPVIQTSSEFRETFVDRGGENAARCYQCATCSSVCELAPPNAPFPRRQILWAQWGMEDRLMSDAGPWLCHQCNDCSVRCPREVNPGDVMASIRAMMVERLATPKFLGSLVGNVKSTWPLLIFGPLLYWIILMGATGHLFAIPEAHSGGVNGFFKYEEFVPHALIYITYFAATFFALAALWSSGSRYWKLLGANQPHSGSLLSALVPSVLDVATHKKFSLCDRGMGQRRWGHFLVMWGFVGAAITSGFAVVYLYKDTVFFSWLNLGFTYPVPITHWVKWLGNISAVMLVVGGLLLWLNRRKPFDKLIGVTTPFDRFFLWVVLGVIGTGVVTEILRFVPVPPIAACTVYLVHLSIILTLFLTLPYSKFAHIVYRTLAMAHERLTVDNT